MQVFSARAERQSALFLGFAIPDNVAQQLFAIDPRPAIQTHNFGWSFIRALQAGFGSVQLLSSCPVQNYPLVPRIIFRGFNFEQHGAAGRCMGFVNLVLLKHVTRLWACIFNLGWVRRCGAGAVFIHGLHSPYLLFGVLLSLLGFRVIPILTDPPSLILPTDGAVTRLLKTVDQWIIKRLLARSFAVVGLAKALTDTYAPRGPSLVFPGILNSEWTRLIETVTPQPTVRQFTVLYSGGLNAAYGVDRLLQAAELLPQFRFVFFGKGDQEAAMAGRANVEYRGFVGAQELASHVLAADVLINPRPTHEAFAQNSFPSKLIEYVASARPVLTTRIPAIPDEVKDCFHYIDDESPEGIAASILALSALGSQKRLSDAAHAQQQVSELYSEAAIGARLASIIPAG